MKRILSTTVVGTLALGLFIGCGGEAVDNDEALYAEALTSTTAMSLDDFDLAHCKENLFKRFWAQEKRDEVCDQIDAMIQKVQAFIAEYQDDHLVGIGGVLLTDACVGGFATLYAEENGSRVPNDYAE